jgi:hypothetical protein
VQQKRVVSLIVAIVLLYGLFLCSGCSPEADNRGNVDAGELYNQIETGMSYDAVMEIMGDYKTFTDSDGEIDTPAGKVHMQAMSWLFDRQIITVIFENGVLQSRDLSNI